MGFFLTTDPVPTLWTLGSDSSGEGGPSSGFFWPRNPVSWTPGTPVSGSGTPFNRPDPRN